MNNFDKNVPFDPGYSQISFSFVNEINYITEQYKQIKAPHQKKFWLTKFEPTIVDLINKSTAFYLGCLLWGGFIHFRFKDSPKEITGNNTEKLSEAEKKELDCASEAKAILHYIESLDRDCKYFLKRATKVTSIIKEILNSYIEFAQINNNFVDVYNTKDIKLPKVLGHFATLSNEQLDKICEAIYATIESGKIEKLLDIGFFFPS